MFSPTKLFKKIGPGVITGASDDDPSGIATYSQAGAQFGFGMLWTALLTTPLMTSVQEMCARIGMTTGRGLMDVLKRHASRRVVLTLCTLLLFANTVNIGADLGAMAAAARLVLPGSQILYLFVFAVVVTGAIIFIPYRRYVNILRWLTIVLFAYIIGAFFVQIDWSMALLRTLIPKFAFNGDSLMMIVAILGTTISPYLFFWQASQEVEEEIANGKADVASRVGTTPEQIKSMRRDVATGMGFSNVVMFFVIVTTAATLGAAGITTITSAAQAAEALRPLAGSAAFWLFTLGIIGTGLLAIPVLAGSASYAISEAFGWREGLSLHFSKAKAFNVVMVIAVMLGLLANLAGIPAIQFLVIAAVINGLVAPIMLWYIIRLADRPDVVGEHRSPTNVRIGAWITFYFMSAAAVGLILQGVL